MPGFRQRLKDAGISVGQPALRELEQAAERAVRIYLGRSRPLRPSALARELKAMPKGLRRAAEAADRMGEAGMLHLLVASCANREPDTLDPGPHREYLARMAQWAERAAEIAALSSRSAANHAGGRTPNENLRSLVTLLMDRFQELLSVRPRHTVDPITGSSHSLFDAFVKDAISQFGPEGLAIEAWQIDAAVRWALESRDFEPFIPPSLPSE